VGWLERWRRRRAEQRAARPRRSSLADRYARFREFVAHNQAVLATIADLQAKAAEGYPVDLGYVRASVDRLAADVERLVETLVAMADGRHAELRAVVARVAGRARQKLEAPPIGPGPLVVPLLDAGDDARQVGGKALQLGRLLRAGLPVPPGFAVTAYGQRLFFERAGLAHLVTEELAGASANDLESLRRAGDAIRARVLAADLPSELEDAVAAAAARVGPTVAVRSSALHEDGDVSFAGQFESALNVPVGDVVAAYRQVIASQFSARALYYGCAHGFSPDEMAMAVLVMRMVDARVAGVLYGADPAQPGVGVRVVNAVWGLGTLAVGGDVTPDVLRVDRAGQVTIAVGDKVRMAECLAAGGIAVRETPPERRHVACLTAEQAQELVALATCAEERLGGAPQDIEWCLDAGGQLSLLQARPLRVGGRGPERPPVAGGTPPLVAHAVVASRGAAAGRVHVMREEGEEVPLGCVLVARSPSLDLTLQLDRIRAMVCEVGSVTSHLATVLREASLPALFGARQACALLPPGEVVTVDAFHGEVHRGRVEALLAAPRPDPGQVRSSRPFRVLRAVLEDVVPLHLPDPRAADFVPDRCDTFHDVTRYAHEMALRSMFEVSERSAEARGAKRLQCDLPLDLWVIDLDRGLRPEAAGQRTVTIDDVRSRPFRAYWRGVAGAGWTEPKPVDVGGFMSVVMAAATSPSLRDRLEERNFALLADSYMNLANRLGFHFAVIDAYLHADDDSHVGLTFYGGGADLQRRVRRVEFLTLVLRHLDFRVQRQQDFLAARIDGYDVATLEERLDALGRLMMAAKQLDMVMFSDAAARQFAHDFITGGYRLKL
jgi:pyruvate,water dikinase